MHEELVFFFQAEDGIRDIGVTGVQTCALPICGLSAPLSLCATGQRGKQSKETVMSDRSLRRLGAASGIFYVVLTILGSDVLGGTKTGVGILVELLGFAFFPFFLGSLWVCLRSAEGDGS